MTASPELVAPEGFFAPVTSDFIDGLLAQYRDRRIKIEKVAALFQGDVGNIISYFMEGNNIDGRGYSSYRAEHLFQQEGAIAALNSGYWAKLLALTDVLDCMPQARRDAWNNQIRLMTTPEFTEDTVRPTLADLLGSRATFFAERVDGIFRGLSDTHVTNSPWGFRARMIMKGVLSSHGSVDSSMAGVVNDLRCIIAKFMGRDQPKYYASMRLIETLKHHWGEWTELDGGALRLRLYRKGTAHLEVHPSIAWRLNETLARLHPSAIPAEHRSAPPKLPKDVAPLRSAMPFAVLDILAAARGTRRRVELGFAVPSTPEHAEAGRVLARLGGVKGRFDDYDFDYDVNHVLDEIIACGYIPDHAIRAVDAPEIGA